MTGFSTASRNPTKHNPFATRFTRPGAIEFLAEQAGLIEQLVSSFQANQCLGQIVGPHGCGKTTLTFSLQSQLNQVFHSIRRVTIRGPREVAASELDSDKGVTSDQSSRDLLLIVDGVERVSWLHQRLLIQNCQRSNTGLLITTHKRVHRVPVLCEIEPRVETLGRLAKQLAPDVSFDAVDLEAIFRQTHGNLRESLMLLYDRVESSR